MRKKLIEVSLPLEAINDACIEEKANPFLDNHPRNIMQWWARRPLAACRVALFASVIDDPSTRPDLFPTDKDQQKERLRLHSLIRELVQWNNAGNLELLGRATSEIAKSNLRLPTILDPFVGAGSAAIEAQRLGIPVQASDLNPVAVLITQSLTEIPARFSNQNPVNPGLSREVRNGSWTNCLGLIHDIEYYGNWMRRIAEDRLRQHYPAYRFQESNRLDECLAWIWCRTVQCPNPACRGQLPLIRSLCLSNKKGKKVYLLPKVKREDGFVEFQITTHEPKSDSGTVSRLGATCLICGTSVPLDYIRAEGQAHPLHQQLLAVVTRDGKKRDFNAATIDQESAALEAKPVWQPETELPVNGLGFRVQNYGLVKHKDLFTGRQLLALTTLCDLVDKAREQIVKDGATGEYATAVATYLGLAVSRFADFSNALCSWNAQNANLRQLFARQAIPMTWDFVETNPFEGLVSFESTVARSAHALRGLRPRSKATILQRDAASLSSDQHFVVCTDPPYYDNIGYADLSDFFYVWLRAALKNLYPELFSTVLTPKQQELIADPGRFDGDAEKAKDFFEKGLRGVFQKLRLIQDTEYPLTLFYAFKQAESADDETGTNGIAVSSTGWETMLQGLIGADFEVTGTWPIRSERGARTRSIGSNALASSILLVLRPRPESASLTTRKDFLAALKKEIPSAVRELQQGNIAPVDLAQAAIGPGMSVFSRYKKVLESDGSPMRVRSALGLINQTLDEVLSEQESEFDPDTRWALAWFEQHAFDDGLYGEAEVLATAKALSVSGLTQTGILYSRAGKVRLLRRDELSDHWDPSADDRLTVWSVTQHLILQLDKHGEAATATLASKVGGLAETARDLAYRLYILSERKGWAEEAGYYNSLVVSWPAIAPKGFELT
jgi:putative DNA methylase